MVSGKTLPLVALLPGNPRLRNGSRWILLTFRYLFCAGRSQWPLDLLIEWPLGVIGFDGLVL